MDTQKSLPKDVFLHLLGIITLYISAASLIALLFQYVNIYFPDLLSPVYYSSVAWPIRWAMASLIIIFPVYILVSWMLNKDYSQHPEKRELKIRKWLVYFTLFLAALIITTDLVTLVYNFLGGELTVRFVLKILIVLVITGTVFGYYLLDLRQKINSRQLSALAMGVSAAMLLSVIAGFFTAGSPFKARLYRFDERRVGDLQILQNEIINYWAQKDELPGTLSDLRSSISGFLPPRDPETGNEYAYRIVSGTPMPTFELCATFNLESEGLLRTPKTAPLEPYYGDPYYPYQQNWDHSSGKNCFERKIDPDFYKPAKERN